MNVARRGSLLCLAILVTCAPLLTGQNLSRNPVGLGRTLLTPQGGTCGPTEITQSVSQSIVTGHSFVCQDPFSGFTFETHSTRAFELEAYGIAGAFAVCEVEVGVEIALAVDGTQPLRVDLYWADHGTFPGGTLTPLGTATITIDDLDLSIVTVPVTGTAPPGTDLVVDVAPSDGNQTFSAFAIGSNDGGQTGPSYITAPDCGIPTPTDLAEVNPPRPDMQIVINVRGDEVLAAAAADPLRVDAHMSPSVVSNLNGVFETGETVRVEPSWTNPSATPFSLTGLAQSLTGPAGPVYTIVGGAADYGAVAPLTTSNCHDATGSCFDLQITGVRPQPHWDATLNETATLTPVAAGGVPPSSHAWTLHVGESFPDVPTANLFYSFVETIFHNGVTGGCAAAPNYCPGDAALRKQMAVFVLRAKEGAVYVPPPAAGIFNDVPASGPFAPWIEELYNRGVVAGCNAPGGPNYCPDDPVLRQQMAVFLLRTLLGAGYTPPACTGVFDDVDCASPFAAWIEDLSTRGIAAGCGGGNFCPSSPNTRGQMAPFLVKTFGLSLYGP
jgi:hypothetical protein